MTDDDRHKLKMAMCDCASRLGFSITEPDECIRYRNELWQACQNSGVDMKGFTFAQFWSVIESEAMKAWLSGEMGIRFR